MFADRCEAWCRDAKKLPNIPTPAVEADDMKVEKWGVRAPMIKAVRRSPRNRWRRRGMWRTITCLAYVIATTDGGV